MNIKERIFTKLALALQSRLKKSYNEFHVNPTYCSVADVRSQLNGSKGGQTDRQMNTVSTNAVHFLLPKELPKQIFPYVQS